MTKWTNFPMKRYILGALDSGQAEIQIGPCIRIRVKIIKIKLSIDKWHKWSCQIILNRMFYVFDNQASCIWSSSIMHWIIKNHACYNIMSAIASLIATYKRYALVFLMTPHICFVIFIFESWLFLSFFFNNLV